MQQPYFLRKEDLLGLHAQVVTEEEGRGVRDEFFLDSALSAPQVLYRESETADVFDLAVEYLVTLSKTRPFAQGNQRVALTAALCFLKINGLAVEMFPVYLPALVEALRWEQCHGSFAAQLLFLGCWAKLSESGLDSPELAEKWMIHPQRFRLVMV